MCNLKLGHFLICQNMDSAKINKPALPSQAVFVPSLNKTKIQKSKLSNSAVTFYNFVNFYSVVATFIKPCVTGPSQPCLDWETRD